LEEKRRGGRGEDSQVKEGDMEVENRKIWRWRGRKYLED